MPLVTIPLVGRLGNLLFIYSFARAWAEQNGYELALPPWLGEQVFEIPQAVRPDRYRVDKVFPEETHQNQESLIYTRAQVRQWFQFKPQVLERLKPVQSPGVLLNVRGARDYLDAGLVCISRESYLDACQNHLGSLDGIGWETDTEPTRLPDFTGNPSACGLGTAPVSIPSFYRLMQAPVLFRANSTFSWWAATLSRGRVFSPVIKGIKGGVPQARCNEFVEGNWPVMCDNSPNTDLHLKEL